MAIQINNVYEVNHVHGMKKSEIENCIQIAYKRELNRQILRERYLEMLSYREIIEKHFPELKDKSDNVFRSKVKQIQSMETKFYRIVRNREVRDA